MAKEEATPNIAVVGGGITGAFTAYFLARLGLRATLIERGEIGGEASGRNPGGLNPLHGAGIPGVMEGMALASFHLHRECWDAIRHLAGAGFSPRAVPRIHLALDERDVEQLERAKERYDRASGFSARWLDTGGLLAIEPRLTPAARGGLWTWGNARVEARAYTRTVAAAAVRLGARVVNSAAHGLRSSGNRVTGVLLDSGRLTCDGVVIASGPWCTGPARWLDIPIPVVPVKGEMLLVKANGGAVHTDLAWRDAAVYSGGGERALLGGTEDHVGYERAPSAEARETILQKVGRLLPTLRHSAVLQQTAALRPVTPDDIPTVGIADGWENACLAVGSGRKGMLFSAGIGRAAAELIAHGHTRLPIQPCSPARWMTAPASMGTAR